MKFLTDFADQAVVLPLTATVAIMLLLLGWWRGAIGWALAVPGTVVIVLSLKIIFYACHAVLPDWGVPPWCMAGFWCCLARAAREVRHGICC